MSQKVSVAVVGYGYWGPNLVRNFEGTDCVAMKLLCDKDSKRLALAQKRSPALEVTTDYDVVLKDASINAVAIATPVHTHYEFAKAALESGKHVLVEKPMTMRVDHAEELVELATKKELVLMVDHVFVYSSPVIKMKEILDSGRLGKLYFIDSVRINLGLFQHDVNVVWDLAPHDISIVDHLISRLPRSLSAFGSVHATNEIEDVAYMNLDFGDGLIANFHVNWLSPVKVRHMILGGSEQSLIYNDLDGSEKIKVYDRGINLTNDPEHRRQALISYRSGDVWSPNIPNAEPLSRMVQDFATCVQQGKRPVADGEAGVRVVKILEAAQHSIKAQGGRIAL